MFEFSYEKDIKHQIFIFFSSFLWMGSLFLFFAKKYSVSFCVLTNDLNAM